MGRTATKTGSLTAADWIILTGAGTYLGWTIVPAWYRAGGGKAFGIPLPSYTFNAWRGTTTFAALVAIVAIAWLGLRRGGVRPWTGTGPNVVDLILALAGVVLTLLGLAVLPETGVGRASVSWAMSVGIALALLWVYGAFRKYRERSSDRSATNAGSGFGTGVRP